MEFVFIVPGFLMLLVGWIWFLMLAFQESVMWGIGCLVCGIVQIVFLVRNIEDTWKPFALQIGGAILFGIGAALGNPGGV